MDPLIPDDKANEKPSRAEKKPSAKRPEFPREMELTNETAMPFVVARTHVPPGETVPVTVTDEDHLMRIQSDIEQLLTLNDNYASADPKPLRVE